MFLYLLILAIALFSALGYYVVSSEHGAGKDGKWYPEYANELTGKDVRIIPDNDIVGQQFVIDTIIPSIMPCVKSLKVYDLQNICPSLPEGGDISDIIAEYGQEQTTGTFIRDQIKGI